MPVNVDPPRGDPVENSAAVLRVKVHAFRAHDSQRIRPRLHLRVGMPNRRAIARDERSLIGHRAVSGSCSPTRNAERDQALSASGVSESNLGISPMTSTRPYCSMACRLSALAGPII